jgi:hypothetical protein
MWKKNILICCIAFLIAGQVTAQVNLQTGGAVYSLPVFNWQDQHSRLTSSIALNYSSGSGLKVTDVASNIGQGWELVAGGVITRLQVGEPDDQKPLDGAVEDVNKYPAGNLFTSVYNAQKGCPTALTRYPLFRDKNHVYKQHNFVAQDKEVDYFSFQFNGRSGLFILERLNASNTISFIDRQTHALLSGKFLTDETMINEGIRTVISGFVISDENGVIYTFKQRSLTKVLKTAYCDGNLVQEQTQPQFKGNNVYHEASFDHNQVNPYVINSWYLSEVTDMTGRKIIFNYENREINAGAGTEICYYQEPDYCVISHKKSVSRTPVLSSIQFPDGHQVVFNYGQYRIDLPGDKVLSSIDLLYKQRYMSRYQLNTCLK